MILNCRVSHCNFVRSLCYLFNRSRKTNEEKWQVSKLFWEISLNKGHLCYAHQVRICSATHYLWTYLRQIIVNVHCRAIFIGRKKEASAFVWLDVHLLCLADYWSKFSINELANCIRILAQCQPQCQVSSVGIGHLVKLIWHALARQRGCENLQGYISVECYSSIEGKLILFS